MTKETALGAVQDSVSSIFSKEDVLKLIEQISDVKSENAFGLTKDEMDELTLSIAENISDEGVDLFGDYDLEMNCKEVELSSVEYRMSSLKEAIKDAINRFIEDIQSKDDE